MLLRGDVYEVHPRTPCPADAVKSVPYFDILTAARAPFSIHNKLTLL